MYHQEEMYHVQDGAFEKLMADIQEAIDQATSEDGGGWWVRDDGILVCEIQTSRDPSRSNNGGEYYFYREFNPDGLGVLARDDWSADWDIMQYGGTQEYYDCVISSDGLQRMARLAEVTIAARAWLNKEPGCMKRLKAAIRAIEE